MASTRTVRRAGRPPRGVRGARAPLVVLDTASRLPLWRQVYD